MFFVFGSLMAPHRGGVTAGNENLKPRQCGQLFKKTEASKNTFITGQLSSYCSVC